MNRIAVILTILVLSGNLSFAGEELAFKLPKALKKAYVFIPPGKVSATENKTANIPAFWMSTTEVTNLQYREFLDDLKKQGKTEELEIARIDSMNWKHPKAYNDPMAELYHSHPAYNNYPVVNISHEAAELYCQWLTEKYNELYGDEFRFRVFLPGHEQWTYAARGGYNKSQYPWGGPYLRNAKGYYLCNFRTLSAENIHYNDSLKEYQLIGTAGMGSFPGDGGMLTTPVRTYEANTYGLYDMAGNVAEMVKEKGIACGGGYKSSGYDVRVESTIHYASVQTDIGFRPCLTIIKKD